MGRTAAWRKGDLLWACGNPDWRQPESYGLTSETPWQGWAWEFLRRKVAYRVSVDERDHKSAETWGLGALVDYRVAFNNLEDSSRPQWLALPAFESAHGPGRLPSLKEGQVALIFDLRPELRKDVLQRQLAQFVHRLWNPEQGWGRAEPERRRGGRIHDVRSLLTYLRFADAVAQDQGIDSQELQKALGFTTARAAKQLTEAHNTATSLILSGYLRLVDLDLPPLRSLPAPFGWRPAPTRRPAAPPDDASW